MRRRFGTGPEAKPTGKALTQAINDAFAVAAFAAHGLPIGATDIDILKSWGSQLRVLDQSRYVPGFEGFNLIWLAADIEDRQPGHLSDGANSGSMSSRSQRRLSNRIASRPRPRTRTSRRRIYPFSK